MLAALSFLAALAWNSYDDALVRAKVERKLVLAHVRAATGRANRDADVVLASAESNENLRLMFDAFVLARAGDPIAGTTTTEGPVLVALDPDGRFIASKRIVSEKDIGSFLAVLRERAPEFLHAWRLRAAGKRAFSEVIFGRELVNLGSFRARTVKILSEAARDLRREGNQDAAGYADLWIAVAQYKSTIGAAAFTNTTSSAARRIAAIAKNEATPPYIAAEAWAFLGDVAINNHNFRAAVDAYRTSYELAPPGSPIVLRARRALETYDTQPLPPKGEVRSATVRLLPPARRALTGRAELMIEADPAIASVELFLDDVPAGSDDARPFSVTVDVGPAAVMRTLKAIGYDDSGAALAESVVTINDRADAFHVVITSPAETFVRGDAVIEADVHAPEPRKLSRVDLYWKEDRIATIVAPPYRYRFMFPGDFGYVRAVGVLDDGTTAEDARIYNAAGASASVDVRAVTIYATVTDRNGNRVTGLTPDDFVIEDERTKVPANVTQATDTPVTVGIAIDSSASMGSAIFDMQEIATGFVRSGEGLGDRTFVVAFDNAPRLVHPASTDAESLRQSIVGIAPGGGTSIFDGVIFALQQFQSVPGRKALLLISDGREGLSSQTAEAAIRTARAAAIPIYCLAPRGLHGPALEELSNATGGITLQQPRRGELAPIFARIRDDVRGQYLVTFEPHAAKPGTWREVRVRTKRSDLKVRTVSGYYAK